MEIAINAVLTVAGLVMLCYGGNWLVNGGVAIARKFRISSMVIGMTVVAYGTSTPELAASIAAVGEHSDVVLGNIIGSNIANIGMVIGVAAILIPLTVSKTTLRKDVPIMLGFSLLLIVLSLDGEVSQYDGLLLIGLLVAFTIYTYKGAKDSREKTTEKVKESIRIRSLILLGVGVALLYVGAELTVDNAVAIAKNFGISERIIGITVIAIGTSLPELITSVIAIRKGHSDIGIGNILGSNIYNILMIMGVAATISGVAVAPEALYDYIIMIVFSMTLFLGMISGVINKKMGIGLVIAYCAYLASSLLL
ncbi:MAG: calcium/sodium antiporter [Thaumarchaeota archaeon]|nr:calcium/sodium antiporter [Nitrososphaerota archaeon]